MILSGRAQDTHIYIYIYIHIYRYIYIYIYQCLYKPLHLHLIFLLYKYICVRILYNGVLKSSLLDKGTIGQPP